MAVTFENTRFDPDLIEFHGIAQQMAASVGYTADMSIDAGLAQLLRLRVAQLNPCSYCLILHTRAAQDRGIDVEKIAHLPAWRESTMFTAAERSALAYAEALTAYDLAAFPSRHAALTGHFDQTAIAEIAAVVINMNVWTRLKLAQGAVPVEV
ncbi:carboxymuconolactone decarboxylase family protein [Tabrizicola sp. M-4]|jgi:AhpD family alkylhydroperoxidase|uniref:carboxymuconolactone decarboxylase family protein n=1 Tax=Tabrizicola sp. M-4 TaxID=3055847 RepID=UPI003DA873E0